MEQLPARTADRPFVGGKVGSVLPDISPVRRKFSGRPGDTRSTCDQLHAGEGFSDTHQVGVVDSVNDGMAVAAS